MLFILAGEVLKNWSTFLALQGTGTDQNIPVLVEF
jgi:hypothetical protein